MTRFFIEPTSITGSEIEFDSHDSHHLAVVLKRRIGDSVLVCDGSGTEYLVVLDHVSKNMSSGKITDMYRLATEPTTKVTVAQSLPRTLEKLEWVLQHGTELGTVRFIPFHSARSREDWQRLVPKRDRWQEIVKTAAEQSRRAVCPVVAPIISFDEVTETVNQYDLALFANESEKETSLRSILTESTASNILIIIGPEGGFTEQEVLKAKEKKAHSITLGPRILRTETAALCLLSQIYYANESL
jgi:16S rRNA (uracil1498-N3)-methyltransferase